MWSFFVCLMNFISAARYQINTLRFEFHPDINLNFEQTVRKYGYPFESHRLLTDDGYILNIFRIPHGRNSAKVNPHPVLLTHGTGASADLFIISGPGKALAYHLADNGFDVWLINHRGSVYSQFHINMTNEYYSKYWDFGWHEVGYYDYATTIDHVLKTTRQEQLFFIGHSQGNTCYFPLTTDRPEYNKKIRFAVLMAPPWFLNRVEMPPVRFLAKFSSIIYQFLLRFFNLRMLFPNNAMVLRIARTICAETTVFNDLCKQILYFGDWKNAMDSELVQMILRTSPFGSSALTFVHYGQVAATGITAHLNYGADENLRRYGSIEPPIYNLSLSTAPLGLAYSPNDYITPETQIPDFQSSLPNLKYLHRVPGFHNYTHVDFLFARDAYKLVYQPIVDLFYKVLKDNK